ncbi:MAG: hypothetical protein J5I94_10050 [Phaeodactylibacter sp.]|nr:hypothetical protein [Phaeodactylibacter sp.]
MKTNALLFAFFALFFLPFILSAQHSLGAQGALWRTQPLQQEGRHDYQGGLSYSAGLNYFHQLPASGWQLFAGLRFSNLEQRYSLKQRYSSGQPFFPNIPIDPQVINNNQNTITESQVFSFGPAESYHGRQFNSRYLGMQFGARFFATDGPLRLFLQPYGAANIYLNTRYNQPVLVFYGPSGSIFQPNSQDVIRATGRLGGYRRLSLSAGLGLGVEKMLAPGVYVFAMPAAEYTITGPLKDSPDKNFLHLGGALGLRFEY